MPIFFLIGIAAMCVGHPMDTIRIVQQVTNTTTTKAARIIYDKHKVLLKISLYLSSYSLFKYT